MKNSDRIELKQILRDLAGDGTIVKQGRKLHQAETLPPTLMADITGRDSDGELLATPTEWDEEAGTPPKIRIHVPRRAKPGTAVGVGDRALLRIEAIERRTTTALQRPRHQGDRSHRSRILGIYRALPQGGGRLVPVDKKQAGRELNIAQADSAGAEDGDLVGVELVRTRGFGLASAGQGTARLARDRKGRQPDRDPHP